MKNSGKPKVLVAMSGGVDSSVAAAMLVRQGYDVVGCFMRLGSPGESLHEGLEPVDSARQCRTSDGSSRGLKIGKQGCCSINDAEDARFVAGQLGVPFYVCNFKKDFGRIIDYFVDEYNAGRTPNPCVRCNDWLKFGKLHEYARQLGAQYVASGHYARITDAQSGNARLRMGVDRTKDQSYVLFGAPRSRLTEMMLPIGEFEKTQVRAMAREWGLPVFDKPDSQEICFVPDNDYARLVQLRTPEQVNEGKIVDAAGEVIGSHSGHQHFTIGQRRGLGIAFSEPRYVVDKNAESNVITVGTREQLLSTGCQAAEANWLCDLPPDRQWLPCQAKIRYNAQPVGAQVRSDGPDAIEVRFDQPQSAVAPGQAVVCYDDDAVICGGWIANAVNRRSTDGGPDRCNYSADG